MLRLRKDAIAVLGDKDWPGKARTEVDRVGKIFKAGFDNVEKSNWFRNHSDRTKLRPLEDAWSTKTCKT